jgi:hypothetical protein
MAYRQKPYSWEVVVSGGYGTLASCESYLIDAALSDELEFLLGLYQTGAALIAVISERVQATDQMQKT